MIFPSDQPSTLERLSWLAQVIAALFAIVGVVFAGWQLRAVRRSSQASLLLELDARFDSPDLRDAKLLFGSLRTKVKATVGQRDPQANDQRKQAMMEEEWRAVLAELRRVAPDEYVKLIGWIGFFETLGIMVKRRYISQADTFDLFKGPLIDVGTSFRAHIADRGQETGTAAGLFEHALALSAKAAGNR